MALYLYPVDKTEENLPYTAPSVTLHRSINYPTLLHQLPDTTLSFSLHRLLHQLPYLD